MSAVGSRFVAMTEFGTCDGFQAEKKQISAADKITLIDVVDVMAQVVIAKEVEKIVGRQLPGQMMKAGPRLKLMSAASVRPVVG
ncbi:MAG: hypothetical protein WCJ34_12565 [Alcaligenaceae bacterium]|jgi:hypothetical protein